MTPLTALLLGGIHPTAAAALQSSGFLVREERRELSGETLHAALPGVHLLGIRSGTKVDARALAASTDLLAVGCFCIGVNQVDLGAAAEMGVPIFNAPFSNTRSVAELVIGETILLMRSVPEKNAALHRGTWLKSAAGSTEIRGKTLGIVGYGHIGTQVGILAEALGMRVLFHDTEKKLALGNAAPAQSLEDLLARSDVVTLHVPGGAATERMIGEAQFAAMRPGARLLNASRGTVVDISALVAALESGRLAGAALDVFPSEPASKDEEFVSPLRAFENVLLTPHVGGSTAEAQENIGLEVADKLARFALGGSTTMAVNFPEVTLPDAAGRHRILHIHRNVPGVLAAMNDLFAAAHINIAGQSLRTDASTGYVVTDADAPPPPGMLAALEAVPGTIRARILPPPPRP